MLVCFADVPASISQPVKHWLFLLEVIKTFWGGLAVCFLFCALSQWFGGANYDREESQSASRKTEKTMPTLVAELESAFRRTERSNA